MFEQFKKWRLGKQYGYETLFKNQDRSLQGKPGIILADIGMPEAYDPEFYIHYMDHVFQFALPSFLHPIVLADRGIALIDPQNPLARTAFDPCQLVDMHGSSTNREGKPYVECNVTWRGPGMKRDPWDHGHFLYTEEGKGGAPDVCQKTAAKVIGWYYGRLLPEKKVPWEHQCHQIYNQAVASLQNRFPDAAFRHACYVYRDSMAQAVEELLAVGCQTIVYQCFCNPVYSDFEEYAYALPLVHQLVNGRAKVICADQLGNQPEMRAAYAQIVHDHMVSLPQDAKILLILSRHGHPFTQETQDTRGQEYRYPLELEIRAVTERLGIHADVVWSDDEYANEYWDPKNTKLSTRDAYRKAIQEAYDYALEVPTDFIAENTDTMVLHAMKKFGVFAEYDPQAPIPYPDWEQPLVRTFREGKTTGIYVGCPVGPYRKYIVEATVASVCSILNK